MTRSPLTADLPLTEFQSFYWLKEELFTLYSEDMRDGLIVDTQLTIINPFK
jgi:hypothetical protein